MGWALTTHRGRRTMIPTSVETLERRFLDDGFVHIASAFPRELARECRDLLGRELPCDPDDASTWTAPVVRLGEHTDEPFRRAANTPALHAAFDALVGRDRWLARPSLGTFPIRFPTAEEPNDAGWHADAGYYGDDGSMRLNVRSKGRALLMLFLFSDVGEDDAPTRIEVGSHLDVPRLLAPAGEAGLTYIEVAERFDPDRDYPIALATGARATSISVIPSWCTRRNGIAARRPSSWRSRRFFPRSRSRSSATKATTRRSSARSASGSV